MNKFDYCCIINGCNLHRVHRIIPITSSEFEIRYNEIQLCLTRKGDLRGFLTISLIINMEPNPLEFADECVRFYYFNHSSTQQTQTLQTIEKWVNQRSY